MFSYYNHDFFFVKFNSYSLFLEEFMELQIVVAHYFETFILTEKKHLLCENFFSTFIDLYVLSNSICKVMITQ